MTYIVSPHEDRRLESIAAILTLGAHTPPATLALMVLLNVLRRGERPVGQDSELSRLTSTGRR